jgi:4-O-beta-D-mannosyl-D-glucose phosphorylase
MNSLFEERKQQLTARYEELIGRRNEKLPYGNGIYDR